MTTTLRSGTGGRKTPSDPTFHPSRDTPHWAGDETASGQGVLLDLGEDPRRMNLFGGNEARDTGNTSRLRPKEIFGGHPNDVAMLSTQLTDIGRTSVPTKHWTRDLGDVDVVNQGMHRAAGYYSQAGRRGDNPQIGVQMSQYATPSVLLHEMGHAHHYTEVTGEKERGNPSRIYKDARGHSPDPLKEAVADAYVDRYGNHLSGAKTPDDFSHISDRQFGYSSNYEEDEDKGTWDPADRTLYAGTRAHFGETGEIARYQQPPGRGAPGSATDATIAMLHEHSPHARAAWAQLSAKHMTPTTHEGFGEEVTSPMTELAEQAVRRHKDRQLLNSGQFVQESLFGEPEMARNQHGEVPRTMKDVRSSLGAREGDYWELKDKGFKDDY